MSTQRYSNTGTSCNTKQQTLLFSAPHTKYGHSTCRDCDIPQRNSMEFPHLPLDVVTFVSCHSLRTPSDQVTIAAGKSSRVNLRPPRSTMLRKPHKDSLKWRCQASGQGTYSNTPWRIPRIYTCSPFLENLSGRLSVWKAFASRMFGDQVIIGCSRTCHCLPDSRDAPDQQKQITIT